MSDGRWQRVEDIFHQAVELAPEARAAFLDQACGADESLRREVESLLDHESENGSTFAHPANAELLGGPAGNPSGTGGYSKDEAPETIAHYRITAKLGQGGMGAVYRATDTKLGREVAIKVLPAFFANDPDRLARFSREAKVLASLNHPNIAQIYGIEESNGVRALVMELVPGKTLAAHVKPGPLPIETALNYAKQIADAFEAAHEKGITHRDLKPANVVVTPEGVVKVLDFGLAAVSQAPAASEASPTNSPTLTMRATQAGTIMGTAAYMSPEQASGKPVDRRADIWSFGVVLFEMLTGRRLFGGETISHTLADVLRAPIDFDQLPRETPAAIRGLLRRCLERNVRNRLRDIGDARIVIEEALSGAPQDAVPAAVPPRRNLLPWAVAAVGITAAFGVSFVHFRETPPADPVLHLSVPLPGNARAGFAALSPDGRRLVIGFTADGKYQLWLRSLDSSQFQPLPGTEGARALFWSPDSKSIGFFADGKLKTIPAVGGPPQVLCDGAAGGTWNRDGVILFGLSGIGAPLERVNAAGGACTKVTEPGGGGGHFYPEFLPDGKHFLYAVTGGQEDKWGIYVSSLDAGLDHPASRRLLADRSSAIFVPSTTGKKYGYLLFLRGSTLMAQPFSAEKLQLAGDVFPVAAEVSFSPNVFQIAASASPVGILVYRSDVGETRDQLIWMDRSGKELGKVGGVVDQWHVVLSPDGKTAATMRPNQGMWLYDLQRGGETRFTSPPLAGSAPVWSPEGDLIAFGSGRGLYVKDASGGLKEELLLENENSKTPSDWSRDGRYLIYTEFDPKGLGDIWFLQDPLNKSGERKSVKFQGTEAVESQGQLSPDGRWLAYVSNESGREEVYVRPFPSGPGRWKVSAGRVRGREPRWRRDGKELFFLETSTPVNRLMAVPVQSGPGGDFQAGVPQALFEFRGLVTVTTTNGFIYSPSADGQRFLVAVQSGDAQPTLNVITNWEKAALRGK